MLYYGILLFIVIISVCLIISCIKRANDKIKALDNEYVYMNMNIGVTNSCTLHIISFPVQNKVEVLKEIRLLTGMSLKKSIALIESLPAIVSNNLSCEEAQCFKTKLEKLGAVVDIE